MKKVYIVLMMTMSLVGKSAKEKFFEGAAWGDTLSVSSALRDGVGLEDKNGLGRTALIVAVMHSKGGMMSHLKDAGASLDEPDEDGLTAFLHACLLGSHKLAAMLKDWGADIDKGPHGKNPITWAREVGNTTLADFLLEIGVPEP